jgi:hypothetical protein
MDREPLNRELLNLFKPLSSFLSNAQAVEFSCVPPTSRLTFFRNGHIMMTMKSGGAL